MPAPSSSPGHIESWNDKNSHTTSNTSSQTPLPRSTSSSLSLFVTSPHRSDRRPSPSSVSLESLLESSDALLQQEYDAILADQEAQRDRLHQNTNNKQCTDNILETLEIMKKHVVEIERQEHERYVNMVELLEKNLLFSLIVRDEVVSDGDGDGCEAVDSNGSSRFTKKFPCVNNEHHCPGDSDVSEILTLDDVDEYNDLVEYKSKILLEVRLVKFFMLTVIANEANVAFSVGQRSDPRKYLNFPLYLKFILGELENVPFNTHNTPFLVRDFIADASLYYTNGIVKPKLQKVFYTHPKYRKRP